MKKKKTISIGKVFFNVPVALILIIIALLVLVPVIWMTFSAFKTEREIISWPPTFIPKTFTLENFVDVQGRINIIRYIANSVIYAGVTTALAVVVNSMAGYAYAFYEFKGKTGTFLMTLATMMVPFQVTMIPTYIICSKLNILNSMSALIIPFMVSGFGIFLCRQFAESIPNDILEAARIDGAGEWRIFFGIVIHTIKPAIAALCIFIFMGRWNDYLWPLIAIVDEDKMTLPLALNFFNSSLLTDYCTSMSAGVLVMIPIIIIYFIFQKQFIEGITMTGIK